MIRCRFAWLLLLITTVVAEPSANVTRIASQQDSAEDKAREAAIAAARADAERRRNALLAMTPEQKRQMAEERERRNRIPLATDDYDWHRIARKRGLRDDDIRRLAEQKLLVGREQLRQSFEIYTDPVVPVFITSDALLNGFNALFEDSFRELEIRRAPELRAYLEQVVTRARANLQKAPFPTSDLAPGWQHAQRVVGPALVLLGTPLDFFDADVRDDITTEVRRIRSADTVELPKWLAPTTPAFVAIDYRRMKPVGFYSGLTSLADYFRAVRWLQSVPFRPERDNELAAIALLGSGVDFRTNPDDGFLGKYERFLGRPEDRGILDATYMMPSSDGPRPASWSAFLDERRAAMRPSHPNVRDTVRTTNHPPELPWYYVLPAPALLDAQMFQTLVDHGESASGIDLARVLGSTMTLQTKPRDPAFVTTTIQRTSDWLLVDDLFGTGNAEPRYFDERSPTYDDYLAVLHTLFAPADPDAPAFMSSPAWSIKSTQTCLAGWAQMRHTFALQAKQVIVTFGMHQQPPGFIEPNPVFLRRFSEFLERTKTKLEAEGVFTENAASLSALLLTRADGIDRMAAKVAAGWRPDGSSLTNDVGAWLFRGINFRGLPQTDETSDILRAAAKALSPDNQNVSPEPLRRLSAYLRQYAARYEHGTLAVPQDYNRYDTLLSRWQTLEQTVFRLETLLQKQLRGRPWTDDEGRFIKEFGPRLGAMMGYYGNNYDPRDDAPRCVEFVRYADRDLSLNAAIGRPRVFYVLYPWQGREIYCEGAVMPYYEFTSRDRLTDEQWRDELDSPRAPAQPDWTNPISTGPLQPPE